MSESRDNLSDMALMILVKKLEKKGFKVNAKARKSYKDNVINVLNKEPHLLDLYSRKPITFKKDIGTFVNNIIKIREKSAIHGYSINNKQLAIAFGKCGPHRLRC